MIYDFQLEKVLEGTGISEKNPPLQALPINVDHYDKAVYASKFLIIVACGFERDFSAVKNESCI